MTSLKIADLQRDAREEGISIGIEQGREEGISIGLERGIERGAYEKALETAQAFLSEGLAPAMVAKCTGLSLEIVQELMIN